MANAGALKKPMQAEGKVSLLQRLHVIEHLEKSLVLAHKRGENIQKPMPGDLVRVIQTDDVLITVGSYGVIEGVANQFKEKYSVCFNPSPLPWWDNNIINSSGGPVRIIKSKDLQSTRERKTQIFQRWKDLPRADGAEQIEKEVSVFNVNL